MIQIKLPHEPEHMVHELSSEKKMKKFLEDSRVTFHMLEWEDWGNGRIYNGIC